jgi:hypothetical protein
MLLAFKLKGDRGGVLTSERMMPYFLSSCTVFRSGSKEASVLSVLFRMSRMHPITSRSWDASPLSTSISNCTKTRETPVLLM